MKIIRKSMLGAGAAALALAGVAATPAMANHEYERGRDEIKAGDIIAGALIIGGLAAVLSSGKKHRRDRDYHGDDYDRGGHDDRGYGNDGGRYAVDQCVNAVEREASRYGGGNVTEIRSIDSSGYGYRVKGKLVINDRDGYDYRYGRYDRDYDSTKFTCDIENGRITNLDIKGYNRW